MQRFPTLNNNVIEPPARWPGSHHIFKFLNYDSRRETGGTRIRPKRKKNQQQMNINGCCETTFGVNMRNTGCILAWLVLIGLLLFGCCCSGGLDGVTSGPATFEGKSCDAQSDYQKNKCYGCSALEHNDLNICKKLASQDSIDTCYLVAAVGGSACNGLKGKGETACDLIEDTDKMGACYLAISEW